jgi:protein-S-isoprenylcysteine O-methyltransferase Ste14
MSKSQGGWWPTDLAHWLVLLQGAVIFFVLLGPAVELPATRFSASFRPAGVGLMLCGFVLGVEALRRLRTSITAAGGLKSDGTLVTSGPYRRIRHPVYTAQMLVSFGWSLAVGGWLTALCALLLSILLYFKALGEERRLLLRFSEYHDYKVHTRRFIPFIF